MYKCCKPTRVKNATWKVELRHRLTATYHQRSRAESKVFSAMHVTFPLFSEQPDQYTDVSIMMDWRLSGMMCGGDVRSIHDCDTPQITCCIVYVKQSKHSLINLLTYYFNFQSHSSDTVWSAGLSTSNHRSSAQLIN